MNNLVPVKQKVNYEKNLMTEIFKESGTRSTETCATWFVCVSVAKGSFAFTHFHYSMGSWTSFMWRTPSLQCEALSWRLQALPALELDWPFWSDEISPFLPHHLSTFTINSTGAENLRSQDRWVNERMSEWRKILNILAIKESVTLVISQ